MWFSEYSACLQVLSNFSLSSADLSFISRIPLDLATPSTLISFFIDQGLLNARHLVDPVFDCSDLRVAVSGPGDNTTDDDGEDLFGPIGSACIKGLTVREDSVATVERKLFCQSAKDTVRSAAFVCAVQLF
jgi:hypothetical protein